MKLKNLLTRVKGSVGSNMFRSYFDDNGNDILEDGNLSCALFVSMILQSLGLIKQTHCTVAGTMRDVIDSGWRKIEEPKEGCLVVWKPVAQNGKKHYHIGFYIGNDEAISNRSSMGVPAPHKLNYTGLDKEGELKEVSIASLWWHRDLV